MTVYTTKQLAKLMGVASGTVIDWGRKIRWVCRPDPYGSGGFIWDVTPEQIEEYHIIRSRNAYISPEERRKRMCDMIDLWDMAFSGRTFPRNIREIDMTKWTVTYTNVSPDGYEPEPNAPPCRKGKCGLPRMRNSYGTFYAYCRDHHNEMQREAGYRHRRKKKEQMNAQKTTQQSNVIFKKELTSKFLPV